MKDSQPVSLRACSLSDIDAIRSILQQWIRDSETGELIGSEVDTVCQNITESVNENAPARYRLAELAGEVVGVVGFRPLCDKYMLEFSFSRNPAELINLYVDGACRGKGVGRLLVEDVLARARDSGYDEVLINSGPRYERTAWRFYDKICGDRVGLLKDFYGVGRDAPLWRIEC